MKIYWDTSAIIIFYTHGKLHEISGVTRPHTLTEAFSTLTGRGVITYKPDGTPKATKLSPNLAQRLIRQIHSKLTYVDLTPDEMVNALKDAEKKQIQGGRVHDLMHAVAAEKSGADELWTFDRSDFIGLGSTPLKEPVL
jgi:predicted nucleic acid-binding protein